MTETPSPATPAVPPQPLPLLVGIADLALRWGYTRQGVHKVVAGDDFPRPAVALNEGRVRVWRLGEVEALVVRLFHGLPFRRGGTTKSA